MADKKTKYRQPAKTPEGREQQLIGLAYDLAEKQIIDGTASSQVVSHFLRVGATRNVLEMEKIRREVSLLAAKTTALESLESLQQLYTSALDAMRSYKGTPDNEEDED